MTNYPEFTLDAIQAAPVYFDREASTDKACQLFEDAGQKGANFVAFGKLGYQVIHSSSWKPVDGADSYILQFTAPQRRPHGIRNRCNHQRTLHGSLRHERRIRMESAIILIMTPVPAVIRK